MTFNKFFDSYISELRTSIESVSFDDVKKVAEVLQSALQLKHFIFLVGNGGSATIASHFASDLNRCMTGKRIRGIAAVSLTDNIAAFTATANDTGYTTVFAELLALYIREGDVLVAISSSGTSPNILEAVEVARGQKAIVIGLIGFGGGELSKNVDYKICLDARHYGVIEDTHLALCHILSMYLAGPARMSRPGERPKASING